MGVLNAGEDTDRHNKVIQGGSKAYAGVVTLFRIISTRNSPRLLVFCARQAVPGSLTRSKPPGQFPHQVIIFISETQALNILELIINALLINCFALEI